MNIRIPRWVQMVGLPILVLLTWFIASALIQVLFIFAASMVLALMINPLVKRLEWLHIPRYLAVLVVFLSLLALIVVFLIIIIPPTISQLQDLVNNLPSYVDTVRETVRGWKSSLESLNLPFDVSAQTDNLVNRLESAVVDLGSLLLAYSINLVSALTTAFLIVVITIYMLLDAKRIGRFVRGLFPAGRQDDATDFIQRSERAVTHWVRAQALLSLLIGISSGLGIWILGAVGIWPQGAQYSVFFGAWAGIMEFIPYIGPILAAAPPVFIAFFSSPWISLAVILVFVFIQQVEGHVLVPNIMGQAVGVHPLVVIFAVLAGANTFGIAGMLLALPMMALGHELYGFFKPRVKLEKWRAGSPAPPITEQTEPEGD
ncbi:MAG: AI-2E family transporter [Thermoleophilia bacterium]